MIGQARPYTFLLTTMQVLENDKNMSKIIVEQS